MITMQNRKLLLIPSEVNKMALEMKSAIASYSYELYDAIAPISSYTQESGLSGGAYTNCKNHMFDHITVIRGMILANNEFESCLDTLSSIVGSERLDEGELEVIIENCTNSINNYNDRISDYETRLRDANYSLYCGNYARQQIRNCNRIIDNLSKARKLAEDKIKKLHEISAESAKCFESISGAYENAVKGINSLNSGRTIKGFKPYVDEKWRLDIKTAVAGSSKKGFLKMMGDHFGLNQSQAEILYDLYARLKVYGVVNPDSEFIKLIASVNYGNDKMNPMGAWNFTIGLYNTEDFKTIMRKIGYDDYQIDNIRTMVDEQHLSCDEKGTNDLSHMFATLEANRGSLRLPKYVGNLAGIYNGVYSFADNAGYIGDICGTNNAPPNMNKSDYKSDLDAVNLTKRLKNGKHSILSVMNSYYEEIDSGKMNRAKEFKNNVGKSRLVENRTKYKEWLTKEYGECIDREKADVYYINDKMHGYKSYQERLKLYDEFIDALDNNKNELERDLIWQSTEQ